MRGRVSQSKRKETKTVICYTVWTKKLLPSTLLRYIPLEPTKSAKTVCVCMKSENSEQPRREGKRDGGGKRRGVR